MLEVVENTRKGIDFQWHEKNLIKTSHGLLFIITAYSQHDNFPQNYDKVITLKVLFPSSLT